MNSSSYSSEKSSKKVKKISHTPQKHIITGVTQTNISYPQGQISYNVSSNQSNSFEFPNKNNNTVQYVQYQPPQSVTLSGRVPKRQTHILRQAELRYEGQVLNNTMHGYGTLYQLNNPNKKYLYEGKFENGARSGIGHYMYPDGSQYNGEWRNNMKEGQGVYYNKKGQKYDGRWVRNRRQGTGKLTLQNGIILQGVWKDDQFVSGRAVYPNGSSYQGEFNNYSRQGKGTYIYPNKSLYKGQYVNNNKNGQGEYYYQNGDEYKGGFQDNMKHGYNSNYYWKQARQELVGGNFSYNKYQGGGKLIQSLKNK